MNDLPRLLGTRHLMAFVVLTYGLSWSWWVALVIRGQTTHNGVGWPTHLPGLLGPAVAAFVVTAATSGRPGVRELLGRVVRWRFDVRWYALVVLTLLATLPSVLVGSGQRSWSGLLSYSGAPHVADPAAVLLVAYVLVVNGFGEEVGWRGFLAEQLLFRTSRGITAVLVTIVWATWHLPMFWVVADLSALGAVQRVGWLVGLAFGSLFLTWMYDGAGHSILLVALWHTAYNLATATDAARGLPAALVSTAAMVVGVVLVLRPGTWRRPSLAMPERTVTAG